MMKPRNEWNERAISLPLTLVGTKHACFCFFSFLFSSSQEGGKWCSRDYGPSLLCVAGHLMKLICSPSSQLGIDLRVPALTLLLKQGFSICLIRLVSHKEIQTNTRNRRLRTSTRATWRSPVVSLAGGTGARSRSTRPGPTWPPRS